MGEGELSRLSETGLREIAERDAGTFPAPSKAKEPALGPRGPDAQRETCNRRVSGHADVPMAVQAMKARAVEFLTKLFNDEVLLSAVRQAIERSYAALRHEAHIRSFRDAYASLGHRRRQVMALVVRGLSNKLVCVELGISEITVKPHRGH